MVQKAVEALRAIGAELTDDLEAERLAAATELIDALVHPLGPDDIRALVPLLPADGDTAAGLNWSILHAIEAASDWPLWDVLDDPDHEWIRILRLRLTNAGYHPPGRSGPSSA